MKNFYIAMTVLLFISGYAHASTQLYVSSNEDGAKEGVLRVVLKAACDTAGDEVIDFADTSLSQIKIKLQSPLIIPEDCRGTVTLNGSSEVDTLLDGSLFTGGGSDTGDSCILNVYSDNHTISNFSFISNTKGAGLCLFGRDNLVQNNRFGTTQNGANHPNRYGVVISNIFEQDHPNMDGSGNTVRTNTIGPNDQVGIWVQASENIIGGPSFNDDKNTITKNGIAGIYVTGDSNSGVEITHNIISDNGNSGLELDLAADGLSLNDASDADSGPNTLLNFSEAFQIFPLVPSTTGTARYWSWGVTLDGSRVELYRVPSIDNAVQDYGGADTWLSDLTPTDYGYQTDPTLLNFSAGDIVTSLIVDVNNNTSEFSLNIEVGDDEDLDGILDIYETGDGTEATNASNPTTSDSDGDGLPDSVEDKNRNGIWDKADGETSTYKADSDDDGLDDWQELHGDGIYDEGIDTNPNSDDSDGDGLKDGIEDANNNGIWEGYLRETSPLYADSDSDGILDNLDNCPTIYNPGQEDWFCQQ